MDTSQKRELFHQRIGRLGFLFGLACVFPLFIGLFTYFLPLLFIIALYLETLFKIRTDSGGFLSTSTINTSDHLFVITILLLIVILLTATISLFMRRLHDIGQPATWLILFIFPPVGFLLILYLLTAPGDKESNQ